MDDDKELDKLVKALKERLGREPTEDEIMTFIYGDYTARQRIWNKGRKS